MTRFTLTYERHQARVWHLFNDRFVRRPQLSHHITPVGNDNALTRPHDSDVFAKAFEHFIINEVRAYVSYQRLRHRLQYWRSTSGFEVDLIVGQEMAIEIKSAQLVNDKHLKGLRALKEEGLVKHYGIVSLDPEVRTTRDGATIYPWADFLRRLWQGELL